MSECVAAGIVSLLAEAADGCGVKPGDVVEAAGLEPDQLVEPGALLPVSVFERALRYLIERTGDRGLGLRMARAVDLRTQGFWGYALLASLTLRERLELHIRYQKLRFPTELSLSVDGDTAICTITPRGLSPDLIPTMMDWGFAITCLQQRRHLGPNAVHTLWLSYAEEPHHAALAELAGGPLRFEAPFNCLRFPAHYLEQHIPSGDPYLSALARKELDAQLARSAPTNAATPAPLSLLEQVRERLAARLALDASLEAVASDLGLSARTLRRRLAAVGASFQVVLEDTRRARAISCLVDTDIAVDDVGALLGYGDPANFRRAFRRWTGLSPSAYRATRRHERELI